MNFALLGDHEDGLGMARALAASGRHQLGIYCGPAGGVGRLQALGLASPRVGDVEEVLADPSIEMVIVASRLADRPALLRRALQSERHVLCVHPADQTPDIAYEAALMQGDTHTVLLPLLPQTLHPGIQRLAELVRASREPLAMLEVELASAGGVTLEGQAAGRRHALPAWDVLRRVGGEIREVSAFASRDELVPDEPLLLTGKFDRGGLFRASLQPKQAQPRWRLLATAPSLRAELVFPSGWPGPAELTWQQGDQPGAESWPAWDSWPPFVAVFESALEIPPRPGAVTWDDETRGLELDDGARRSVTHRRVSILEYPEASEEVGFKGTMTLVGCGLLWISLLLLIFSNWVPWLGWVIAPVLVVFLGLQLLRWVIPGKKPG